MRVGCTFKALVFSCNMNTNIIHRVVKKQTGRVRESTYFEKATGHWFVLFLAAAEMSDNIKIDVNDHRCTQRSSLTCADCG